jgi:hypothetical protein
MKIAYFINTFKSSNWGGQATSAGIQYLISKEYPDAEFIPIDLPDLPFKKIKIFRYYYNFLLKKALMSDNKKNILQILKRMNIPENFFDAYTHVCFNGEGAVHYASGHLIRFMGMLYLAKMKHKTIASINQTIDLNNRTDLEALLSKIYNLCDFVSVREPLSWEYAKKIGIKKCQLIPDAVYGLPKIGSREIDEIIKKYKLPKQFVSVTGSSILNRNKNSIKKMDKILDSIKTVFFGIPIVFMANAKTDIYLAYKLKKKYDLIVLQTPNVNYYEAMAIFSRAVILVGGRQHPNIFAYIYRVPYLAFDGNTYKNRGVALLQNYPYMPLSYEAKQEEIVKMLKEIKRDDIKFESIEIKNFRIFENNFIKI